MYTDICSSLSPMRSTSCALPLLVMGFKADTNRNLFICTLASTEEDERSDEPDQAGVNQAAGGNQCHITTQPRSDSKGCCWHEHMLSIFFFSSALFSKCLLIDNTASARCLGMVE